MPGNTRDSICHTNKQTKQTQNRPPPVVFRPKSKKARDKFFELGGSRWINRILEGLAQ